MARRRAETSVFVLMFPPFDLHRVGGGTRVQMLTLDAKCKPSVVTGQVTSERPQCVDLFPFLTPESPFGSRGNHLGTIACSICGRPRQRHGEGGGTVYLCHYDNFLSQQQ